MSGIVAIVGRPNVGKSTLFNRLISQKSAIIDDQSGITRDRNYASAFWGDHDFTVVDTGGFVQGSDDVFETAIREQVHIAINEADLLLFIVDVHVGINPLDEAFANVLRKYSDKVLVVVNKVDNFSQIHDIAEFYAFGIEQIFPISAANGLGTGELLDKVVELLPKGNGTEFNAELPKFAIVGRPNVGKSSIINALLGKSQNIVTPIAGTTRDSIHTRYKAFNKDIYLIDTAGLRKKKKVHENVEFYSVMRTVKAVEQCDVAILVIDSENGLESQDINILRLAVKRRKGLVIFVNKWDIVEKETNTAKLFKEKIEEKIAPLTNIPIVFTSAITKQRVLKGLESGIAVFEEKNKIIPTKKLNEDLLPIIEHKPPPSYRGKFIKIKFITQVSAQSPTFLFFTNYPKQIKESYKRFLENQIRKLYGFDGWALNIFFRKK